MSQNLKQKYIKIIQDKYNECFQSSVVFNNEEQLIKHLKDKPFDKHNIDSWLKFHLSIRRLGRLSLVAREETGYIFPNIQDLFNVDITENKTDRFSEVISFKIFCGQEIGQTIFHKAQLDEDYYIQMIIEAEIDVMPDICYY